MSAFTIASVLGSKIDRGDLKELVISVTGTASYDTGGSVIDLSTANATLGTALGFAAVHGVERIGVTTAADDKYMFTYVRAASGAAATGLLKLRDATAASDAEVTGAVSLAASTFFLRVVGK